MAMEGIYDQEMQEDMFKKRLDQNKDQIDKEKTRNQAARISKMISATKVSSHRFGWQDKGGRGRRANSSWATSRRKQPARFNQDKIADCSNMMLDNDIDMF